MFRVFVARRYHTGVKSPLRVALAFPAARGRPHSLDNYARSILGLDGSYGLEFDAISVPWWRPRALEPAVRWYRRERRPDWERVASADLLHLTDQGLAHHAGRANVPAVVTVHDVLPFTLPEFEGSRARTLLRQALLRPSLAGLGRAAAIVTPTEVTKRELVARFPVDPARVFVVPVMLRDAFGPGEGARGWLAARGRRLPERPCILSVGAVRPHKNLPVLLAALAQPELREAVVVRVGERFPPDLRRLAQRLGVASRVVELGPVDLETVVQANQACDVLAQLSRGEGFGMPVAEAMACGLPVVRSNGAALEEVGGDATVVPNTDLTVATHTAVQARAVARALARVLEDEQLACRLRAAGLARAAAFRAPAVVPRLLAAYGAALDSGAAATSVAAERGTAS